MSKRKPAKRYGNEDSATNTGPTSWVSQGPGHDTSSGSPAAPATDAAQRGATTRSL